MNARQSLRERLSESPWDRGASLLLAGTYLLYVLRNELLGVPNHATSWVTVLLSLRLLAEIWSDRLSRRMVGWFGLILLTILIPAFS
jgi:hypothetical protein